jgi:lipoprotein-anchoring transpeptidase ErfK/SrfK
MFSLFRTFLTIAAASAGVLALSSCGTTKPAGSQLSAHQASRSGNGMLSHSPRKTAKPKDKLVLTSGARVNPFVLSQSTGKNARVVIDIAAQRAYLLVNGRVAVDTPVSTARPGKYTPRGSFSMSEKVRTGKYSTIYGVEMPYWMRLSGTVFGVHAGVLPGYPASAGCVRLPASAAQVIFDNTSYGTRVNIYSSWDGA